MSASEPTEPKVEETKPEETKPEETKPAEAEKPVTSSSVFSMFGGGAKKEKKEEEERGDNSGSAKAQREAAEAAKGDEVRLYVSTELVPAAAQEAERCLEEAKRSLGTASDNFMNTSDSVFKNLGHRFQKAHRSLSWIKTDIRDRAKMATEGISRQLEAVAGDVKQYIPDAQGMQQQAKLELLNAQIRARLWWLKYTAGEKEYTRYQCAAKQFMAKTLSNDRELRKTTNKTSKTSAFEQFFSAWSSKNRRDTGEGQTV
ncbi:hypothetical protein FOC4_g10008032 [Fusarium odoratissimum]|uniref:Uncharacterized protein n=1 Tax=Fusarium oxysporum f. sp. cubense (strain race 4) TaxID=2502994 RepID=N1RP93_FUSC4|nr:hypothetical protein FOC4_g10008032 [Fusarium odoratissimum]